MAPRLLQLGIAGQQLAGARVDQPDQAVAVMQRVALTVAHRPGQATTDPSGIRRDRHYQCAEQGRQDQGDLLAHSQTSQEVGFCCGHQHDQRLAIDKPVADPAHLSVHHGLRAVMAIGRLGSQTQQRGAAHVLAVADPVTIAACQREAVQAHHGHCAPGPLHEVGVPLGEQRRIQGQRQHAGKSAVGPAQTPAQHDRPLAGKAVQHRPAHAHARAGVGGVGPKKKRGSRSLPRAGVVAATIKPCSSNATILTK